MYSTMIRELLWGILTLKHSGLNDDKGENMHNTSVDLFDYLTTLFQLYKLHSFELHVKMINCM
jgi:hypothetical protein